MEKTGRNITMGTYLKICAALDVSAADFLAGEIGNTCFKCKKIGELSSSDRILLNKIINRLQPEQPK